MDAACFWRVEDESPRDWWGLTIHRRQVQLRVCIRSGTPVWGRCNDAGIGTARAARLRVRLPTRLPNLISTPHTMTAESPAFFETATEGDSAFLTPPSTAQASRSSTVPTSNAPPPQYRPAAQLPYELSHHCSVYLGSGQCAAPRLTF